MQPLSGQLLPSLSVPHGQAPSQTRVLQFGEGAFLRAFADHMIDVANERLGLNAGVAILQPLPQGQLPRLAQQDGLYTVLLRGMVGGNPVSEARVVTAVRELINPYEQWPQALALVRQPQLRFVVSNTTEAGIVYTGQDSFGDAPPASFPGKVTRLLYERFLAFGGAADKGLIFLPCELIDANGDTLRSCVEAVARQWGLAPAFIDWLGEACVFANTLVDRITPGYPREDAQALWGQLGYRDELLDVAEPFGLWVIEGENLAQELPLDRAGLPVRFVPDATPYKLRKVRMLNGAHTAVCLAAFLAGKDTVGQCMADPAIRAFLTHALYDDILPTLDLPKDDLEAFAASVLERFENPYNPHYLLSIALNSVSKYRARVLPTLLAYRQHTGALPQRLVFALAALIAFYQGEKDAQGAVVGRRGEETYPIVDDPQVLAFFLEQASQGNEALVRAVLLNQGFWGQDLTAIPGLLEEVTRHLCRIHDLGAAQALSHIG